MCSAVCFVQGVRWLTSRCDIFVVRRKEVKEPKVCQYQKEEEAKEVENKLVQAISFPNVRLPSGYMICNVWLQE